MRIVSLGVYTRMKTENKHRNVMRTHAHQIKKKPSADLLASTWLLIQNEVTGRCFLSCSVFSPLSRASTSQLIQDSGGTISRDKKKRVFFLTPCRYNPCFSAAFVSIKCDFRKSSGLLVSAVLPSIFLSLALSLFFRMPISTSQRGYSSWGPPHPSHIIVPSSLITLLRKLGSVTHLPCCAEW